MAQVTAENAIVPSDQLTLAESADELGEYTDVPKALMRVLDARAENNGGEDIVMVLSEWAYEDWSDYDIADQPFMVVGHVEDYSEDAYKVQSAAEVLMGTLQNRSLEEIRDEYLSNLVKRVDNTDEDFHDDEGEAFLPKSAVEAVVVYRQ
jgi:hypothetical protein